MRLRLALLVLLSGLLAVWTTAQDNLEISGSETTLTGNLDQDTPFIEIPVSIDTDNTLLTLDMRAVAGDLDAYLYLLDESDTIIAENDDRNGATQDAFITFPQLAAGDYSVIATRRGVADGLTAGDFELLATLIPEDEAQAISYDVSADALVAAGYPEQEPKAQANWTVLAYYGGDTNLEDGILVDLNEFELAGGTDENVNIVAMIDRHPEYSEASGNWVGAHLYEVTADVPSASESDELTIDSTLLADFGDVDTGTGETFAQFLVWALRAYPANHYAIALASHGAGWRGVIEDDTGEITLLTLPELNAAFAAAKEVAGVEYFDLLVNDACLMSSIEYHNAMSDFFNYSLASPEIVVNPALDMTLFTELLKEEPDLDLADLGMELVDVYITRDAAQEGQSVGVYLTNALTDLRAFDEVVQTLETFSAIIAERPALYSADVGQSRADSYTYTAFARGDDLIDLGSFLQRLIANTQDTEVQQAASDVLEALEDALVYANAGDLVGQQISTYQNIYFPPDSGSFELDYLVEGGLPNWGQMLRTYYNAVTPRVWSTGEDTIAFHPPVAPEIRILNQFPADVMSSATGLALDAEIVGRNIATGDVIYDYTLADGRVVRYTTERILLTTTDEEGRVVRVNPWEAGASTETLLWDGLLPVISDGANTNFESFTITDDVLSIEGRYRQPEGFTWSNVVITFDRETGQVERVINQSTETDSLGVIDIPAGSAFQTYLSEVSVDGSVTQTLGNVYIWGEDGLQWSWQQAPSGEYNIGWLMTAFGGTTGYAFAEVTVDNSDVTPGVRSNFSLLGAYGITPPIDWSPLVFSDRGAFASTNEAGDSGYYVYFDCCTEDPPSNDLENIIERIEDRFGLISEDERTLVTLSNGVLALRFDYQFEVDGELVPGRGLASLGLSSLGNIGLVLAVETTLGDAMLDEMYTNLERNARFLDSVIIQEANDPQWTTLTIGNGAYPVLIDWAGGTDFVDDETWLWSGEGGDPEAANRLAVAVFELDTDLETTLASLLDEYIAPAYDISDQENRTYNAENNAWRSIVFSGTNADGIAIQGRLYGTVFENEVYAVWMEAEDNDTVAEIITTAIEPIVDGFIITPPEEE